MLETLAGWNEDIAEGVFAFEETVERSTTAIISPGVRYAFNLPNDAQLVIGAALPIGLTSDSPDWGLFFYWSFEHPFMEPNVAKQNNQGSGSAKKPHEEIILRLLRRLSTFRARARRGAKGRQSEGPTAGCRLRDRL